MSEPFWAIIPAGGKGVRAGFPAPKQFQEIGGVTVLERTAAKVLDLPGVQGVVVALPASGPSDRADEDEVIAAVRRRLDAMSSPDVPLIVAAGGVTRHESVLNALRLVPPDARWIAVHDASRPFFSADLFARVLDAATRSGAAICAVLPPDTVKMVQGSFVASTLDRDALASVQTPQVFAAEVLRAAHECALRDGFTGTDDSQLVERLGHKVAVVPGERRNLKITYPEDFAVAEVLAAGEDRPDVLVGRQSVPTTGLGFDIHRLVPGRRCVIGGVDIPFDKGLLGHSDGDVLCHAVMDAVLGALGKGDIGVWFPTGDPRYEGASSLSLMSSMWSALKEEARVVNVDAVVVAEQPRIMPHAEDIRRNLAAALDAEPARMSVKATTAEGLGSIGRGEGIATFAVVTLLRRSEQT